MTSTCPVTVQWLEGWSLDTYSETSHTDHLYKSTTSLYGLAFLATEIKSAVSFQCCGKFSKSTTSLNGPAEFTAVSGRLREVLLWYGFESPLT